MNKSVYSDDILWYDERVYNSITALAEEHSNAIPVFGGALGAYNCINSDSPDFKGFMAYIPEVVRAAKFHKWHEGITGALRRFCRLCLVDPALIECYIGMSFDQLCECYK